MHSSLYFRKCARSQWSTVEIQPSQWLKPRKSAWSTVKAPKRVGQSFDLAVAAVTRIYGSDIHLYMVDGIIIPLAEGVTPSVSAVDGMGYSAQTVWRSRPFQSECHCCS